MIIPFTFMIVGGSVFNFFNTAFGIFNEYLWFRLFLLRKSKSYISF